MKKSFVAILMLSLLVLCGIDSVSYAGDADYNWSGLYFGVNAGGVINNSRYNLTPSGDFSTFPNNSLRSDSGNFDNAFFTAGGQVGYNFQISKFIIGLETDFNYNGVDESHSVDRALVAPLVGRFIHTVTQKVDYFGTVRARLGFTPIDRFLAYATGGFAYGHVHSDSNVLFTAAGDTYIGSKSNMQLGWTVGGGGEYAIGKNWTIKAEYLYVDLGSQSYTYGNQCVTGGCTYTTDLKSREHVFRLGLNYKF